MFVINMEKGTCYGFYVGGTARLRSRMYESMVKTDHVFANNLMANNKSSLVRGLSKCIAHLNMFFIYRCRWGHFT